MDYKAILDEISSQIGNAKLMAVSKTRSLEEVQAAYESGFKLFGENHVQEIVAKFGVWKPSDVQVHMIGHLQSNKVGKVVPIADMIQSIDSISLLEKVNNACERIGKTMQVLLEFNTSGEEAKSGFETEDELIKCIEASSQMKNIVIKGLMTVGPVDCLPEDKERLTRDAFRRLSELRDKCIKLFPQVDFSELSMGMSGDYLIGVEMGSTLVRIGTKIFGARNYA